MGWLWALFVVVVVGLVFVVRAQIREERAWDRFKVEQHCKVVGRQKGQTVPVFNANGKGGVGWAVESDKTGWLCDDGVTYWR